MPVEAKLLAATPEPFDACPQCGAAPFVSFIRGVVQRSRRLFWVGPRRPYCTVICSRCKGIVGYESPPSESV